MSTALKRRSPELDTAGELEALGFAPGVAAAAVAGIAKGSRAGAIEHALRAVPLDFDRLPVLFEGESKDVRLWTDDVVVIRFKPTVYSHTHNRYGEAAGTDELRVRFAAAVFRRMAELDWPGDAKPRSAFLAELEDERGPLLVQRRVETCNLETRVKRFHIGSPLHRYLYTERYPTTQSCGPLRRWSRLDRPVVCFDWRHPLTDEDGRRLADEPISDDYAAVWMENVPHAKELARNTFLTLERWFAEAGVCLVDMCLFVDRRGELVYGEISPDCMRVRFGLDNPATARSGDKDVWRSGGSPEAVHAAYVELWSRLFGDEQPHGR